MGEPTSTTTIRFTSFPTTEPPPGIALAVVHIFRSHEARIATENASSGLTSNQVLSCLRTSLGREGFKVETSSKQGGTISRPVFFGENGKPALTYRVDAYNETERCGLEVEAGRALMSNAIYRDLVQALVMINIDHMILAVPNVYRYAAKKSGKTIENTAYGSTVKVAQALYGHRRLTMPYGLTVVGY